MRGTLTRLQVVFVVVGSSLLGILVWFVVGRALRPVERMRATVDRLDDRDLRTRVESPATGDELDRLANTLNELLARLEVAVAREHQFVADASHELRTPIAGVRALLETEAADPTLVVLTRADALARLNQLEDLVDQLLALARADAAGGTAAVAGRPRRARARAGPPARADHHAAGRHVTGVGRPGRRARHRPGTAGREPRRPTRPRYAATTVSFTVHQSGDAVELVVDDDGPGIPPADRELVFERFGTLDGSRSASRSGAGLGLSIVAAIVANHRGTIRIGDAPDGGARFEVRLPAYVPAAERSGDRAGRA